MQVIEGLENVAVPSKNIECANNELLHPRFVDTYKRKFEDLCHCKINTNQELVEQFFSYNKDYDYAGFKSMPVRDGISPGLFDRQDITFIVLTREDILSTVASFVAANRSNSWDRKGGKRSRQVRIRLFDTLMVLGNTFYLRRNVEMIKKIKNPINITYEDLCNPEYHNSALDQFFNEPISLRNPNPPTLGSDYVENWGGFSKFVRNWYTILDFLFEKKLVR